LGSAAAGEPLPPASSPLVNRPGLASPILSDAEADSAIDRLEAKLNKSFRKPYII
jgi:hypothetical protein